MDGVEKIFLTKIFSWPSEFCLKILMPQLKNLEFVHTPVSGCESNRAEGTTCTTIGHCIVQLGLWVH